MDRNYSGKKLQSGFGIVNKTSTFLPIEPKLEARLVDVCPFGESLYIYDKTEEVNAEDFEFQLPRLSVGTSSFDTTQIFKLSVTQSFSKEHVLAKYRTEIVDYCSKVAKQMGYQFINGFYQGFDTRTAEETIVKTFEETRNDILECHSQVERLSWKVNKCPLVGIDSYSDFIKLAVSYMTFLGIQAEPIEKVKFISDWADRLVEEGIISETVIN